jgi:hypothetical protein
MSIENAHIIQASQAFIITGYIISIISIFYTQVIISYVAYSLQFIGLSGFLYSIYVKGMFQYFLPIIGVLFVMAFNLYLLYNYNDKIENRLVPSSYYTFNTCSKWLILLESLLIYNKITTIGGTTLTQPSEPKSSDSTISVLGFLITLNIIIIITESVILGNFSTDG